MKHSIFPLLLLFGLLGLLILLATLQYQWLGEISRNERERMEKRLQTDSQKFVEDFNGELRRAYFAFQFDSSIWVNKDWVEFTRRYKLWRTQTEYPDLIGKFYFVQKDRTPLEFDAEKGEFIPAQTTAELEEVSSGGQEKTGRISIVEPIIKNDYTIATAIYSGGELIGRDENGVPNIEPKVVGFLVFKLDEATVKQLLADLTTRYFSPDPTYNFNLSIVRESDAAEIFKPSENLTAAKNTNDFSVPIYDLSVGNFNVLTRSDIFLSDKPATVLLQKSKDSGNKTVITETATASKTKIFIARSDSNNSMPPPLSSKNDVRVRVFDNQTKEKEKAAKGFWRLNVTHSAGSLDEFVTTTRRKNLAISFGILSLLAASVVLIFFSAQRAKLFAQRQVDFVSAVSHEFRTPLAVIRSAGENLSDGVVRDDRQISQYGTLIKREGVKLSQMVEQILEFAGARSGKRKYDLREASVSEIVEDALLECQPLINEKQFFVETKIQENLPKIVADRHALGQAIQNLIANAVKYSGGNRHIKISAKNGDGKIKIQVEDKGIGIAQKDLKHVFEPFYRSKQVIDEQIHGNGLGLSLVKQIVEAHGGEIKVTSEIGKGSEFTIILNT